VKYKYKTISFWLANWYTTINAA